MKLQLTTLAESDLDDAAAFYEDQEAGLGDEVVNFLLAQIHELEHFAGIHRKKRATYQWVTRGKFPYYVIYYRIMDETVLVEAVLDHRRDPKWIRRTMRDRNNPLS